MKRLIFFSAMIFLVIALGCGTNVIPPVSTTQPVPTSISPTLAVPTQTVIPDTQIPPTLEAPTPTTIPPTLTPLETGSHFVQLATVENISFNYTYIDNPLTNNTPNAIVIVTSNWNPGDIGGTYNNHSFGVWYDDSVQKWAIYNQDQVDMPPGAAFNVLILPIGSTVFVQKAVVENISFNYTYLDHPLTNNTPDAIVIVTSNWNPGNIGGTYNDHSIGVWYDDSVQKWAVYNQDQADMVTGAAFNVLIPPAGSTVYVHTALAENVSNNWTYIDHPLSNNNPNAVVFVTSNWNPGDIGGTYNNHPFGVWYDDSAQKWAIYNQDLSDMPLDSAFNIIVFGN